MGGAKEAMQPCSATTPAASAGGAAPIEGAAADGTVVVVVVVDGSVVVVVVVVVGGTVVVVVVGVSGLNGTVVGTVVAVVVLVVVVGGTVVVVVVGGSVLVVGGTVVVVVLVEAPTADTLDGGGVMVTVAHAPACSRVATSVISCVRSRFSEDSSDVSVRAARAKAFAAAPRRCSATL